MNVPKLFLSVFSVSLLASVVWLQQSSSTAPSDPDLSSAPRVATNQTAQANPASASLDDADRHSLESQVRRDQFAAEPDSRGALRARSVQFMGDGLEPDANHHGLHGSHGWNTERNEEPLSLSVPSVPSVPSVVRSLLNS